MEEFKTGTEDKAGTEDINKQMVYDFKPSSSEDEDHPEVARLPDKKWSIDHSERRHLPGHRRPRISSSSTSTPGRRYRPSGRGRGPAGLRSSPR